MADLPVSFRPEMVRAILREIERPGTGKTQTRRILKRQFPAWVTEAGFTMFTPRRHVSGRGVYVDDAGHNHGPAEKFARLKFAHGDRLWVREAWRVTKALDPTAPRHMDRCTLPEWLATDPPLYQGRIRASMHLPRWTSRLTLSVTQVQVQRLQDISDADALAEGCPASTEEELAGMEPRGWYADLWDSINGSGSWDANPWVAAYTFKPVLANIDAASARRAA